MFFHLFTLGCKVNQYETEFVRTALLLNGYTEADNGEAGEGTIADLVIVNTCTVTAESEAKSRKAIRKLVSEHPGAQVVVMGCAATHQPDAMLQIGGVSQVITDKEQIPALIQQLSLRQLGLTTLPKGIASFGDRHRAFIKIQDGCQVGCAYCIIPKVRPVLRSRPIEEVLPEIQTLARNGYREIVLTGIHLGHYGVDLDGISPDGRLPTAGRQPTVLRTRNCWSAIVDATDRRSVAYLNNRLPSQLSGGQLPTNEHITLTTLLRRAVDLPEEFRIRLSSLEAVEVTDELIDLMLRYPDRICPHLHLSMQSGSDAVLRRMKRRWLSEPFVRRCEEILSRFDRLALTTDVIVGFPGETAEQFDETCQIVERLRFSKVHVFRFSPREGTEAATLPNRVPPSEQKRRSAILTGLADKLRSNFAASLVGSVATVLLETPISGTCGHYLDVRLNQPAEAGTLVDVNIERSEGDVCFGETRD